MNCGTSPMLRAQAHALPHLRPDQEPPARAIDVLSGSPHGQILAQLARSEIATRLRRGRLFKNTLFSDPAWDILLDLFAAEYDGRRRFISSVALTAEIPPTTALRWIGALERERLVRRLPDPLDGRRSFIELTDDGRRAMTAYFGVTS